MGKNKIMRFFFVLLFAGCFLLLQADAIEIAESYRDLIWFINSENIMGNYTLTGNPQDGYTDEHPCDWVDLIGDYSVGMPYHYGGRDDFEQWEDDYVNGVLGPGGHSVHYPGSLVWAAGIDCSGFIGRCWEIDNYTLHMYFNCTYIAANYQEVTIEELQPGDCFVKSGVHSRLFYEWGTDNNVIVIEATSGYYNRVLQMEYDLQLDILDQGYVLRRNIAVDTEEDTIPKSLIQLSNYPNPFNPSTEIRFNISDISEIESVEITIYNLKGQKIKVLSPISCRPELVEGRRDMKVAWNGDDQNGNPVSSGIYLYRLKAGNVNLSRKCLLMK